MWQGDGRLFRRCSQVPFGLLAATFEALAGTTEPGHPWARPSLFRRCSQVPFGLLAGTFEALAGTTKRLEKLRLLATAFWAVLATTPGDLLPFVYLCSNQARAPNKTRSNPEALKIKNPTQTQKGASQGDGTPHTQRS